MHHFCVEFWDFTPVLNLWSFLPLHPVNLQHCVILSHFPPCLFVNRKLYIIQLYRPSCSSSAHHCSVITHHQCSLSLFRCLPLSQTLNCDSITSSLATEFIIYFFVLSTLSLVADGLWYLRNGLSDQALRRHANVPKSRRISSAKWTHALSA